MANMAYNNKFVVSVIINGTFMKELDNGEIQIPFGSEYKIRLRNKHHRRCLCKLSIDGDNVSGGGFVIEANQYIDIERPVDVSKKFKFVSLDSQEAIDFGKNGPNPNKIKGTIIAEFALEKEPCVPPYQPYVRPYVPPYRPYVPPFYYIPQDISPWNISTDIPYQDISQKYQINNWHNQHCESFNNSINLLNNSQTLNSFTVNQQNIKEGATVEGSKSYQNFNKTYFDNENYWTTIRVFLTGYIPNTQTTCENSVNISNTNFQDDELLKLKLQLTQLKIDLEKTKLREEIVFLQKDLEEREKKLLN